MKNAFIIDFCCFSRQWYDRFRRISIDDDAAKAVRLGSRAQGGVPYFWHGRKRVSVSTRSGPVYWLAETYTLLWLLYLYAAQFITADLTQCFLSWRVTAFLLRVVVLWEIIRPRRRGFIGYLVRCKCAEAKWASCSTVPAFSWTRNESSVGWLARTKSRFYGSSVYTCYTVGRGALYLCYCAFGNETVNVNQLTSEIV